MTAHEAGHAIKSSSLTPSQDAAMSLPRRWYVYKGDTHIAEVRDAPGPVVSTSAPPPLPGEDPTMHPFLSLSAFDPETEGEIGALSRAATDLQGYLQSLRDAGYRVEDAPWPDLDEEPPWTIESA